MNDDPARDLAHLALLAFAALLFGIGFCRADRPLIYAFLAFGTATTVAALLPVLALQVLPEQTEE